MKLQYWVNAVAAATSWKEYAAKQLMLSFSGLVY